MDIPAASLVSRAGSFITKDGQKEKIYQVTTEPEYWSKPRFFRTYRNKIKAAMWPGSFFNMTVIIGGVVVVRVSHVAVLEPIRNVLVELENLLPFSNETAAVICGSTLCGLALFSIITFCRRLILRQLLSYTRWIYEPLGKESSMTRAWAILVRFFSGYNPSMYCYQSCLPGLPVPSLDETLKKLIISLEPIYASRPNKFMELKTEAKLFKENVGQKLQRALVLRSFWCDNYVSDWWESYAYLMNRSPLAINSNYYIMDQCYWTPTLRQCARAAGTVYQLLLVREQLLSEDFDPLLIKKLIPVCMNQYRRVFSTTRVPGEEMDTVVHYPANQSQHVVVSRRGLLYKVDIKDVNGQLITPGHLEHQLEWVRQNADATFSEVSEMNRLLPVLTSMDRTTWAKARKEYFSWGMNRETLHYLESAVLFVILDTNSFVDLSSRAAHLLHGDVGAFWFDKSIQLIAMSDGHIGLNCEHSYADAPVVAHIFEHNLTFEILSELYDTDGHCNDPYNTEVSKPTHLTWEVDKKLAALINTACAQAEKSINDLDLVVYDYTDFGKGAVKKCKISPDAFIQMSLNITYRKLTGLPVLTYEASMTRLFKHGRTETVRSLTPEANRFVNAFLDSKRSVEEKRALLKEACEKHVKLYKDAMTGKGIDRHLFALYIASRGMGIDCKFLKKVLSIPWILSTSQQPQQQIPWAPSCEDTKYQNLLSPGGGFGPVADDGYGISYMLPGDLRFFFHISSRHSGRGTNSSKFVETLKNTMTEIIRLHRRTPYS